MSHITIRVFPDPCSHSKHPISACFRQKMGSKLPVRSPFWRQVFNIFQFFGGNIQEIQRPKSCCSRKLGRATQKGPNVGCHIGPNGTSNIWTILSCRTKLARTTRFRPQTFLHIPPKICKILKPTARRVISLEISMTALGDPALYYVFHLFIYLSYLALLRTTY